jgi:hypothetical protein
VGTGEANLQPLIHLLHNRYPLQTPSVLLAITIEEENKKHKQRLQGEILGFGLLYLLWMGLLWVGNTKPLYLDLFKESTMI